jgi:hypothetical protein
MYISIIPDYYIVSNTQKNFIIIYTFFGYSRNYMVILIFWVMIFIKLTIIRVLNRINLFKK